MVNEGFVYDTIMKLPNSPGIALDIGANFGVYTSLLAKKFGHVYAFEPVPDNAAKIRPEPNVTILTMAISNKNEPVKIYMCDNPGGGSINILAPQKGTWGHSMDRFLEVPGITLDEFCKDKKIDFMKVDIEGAEDFIFDTGLQTLRNNDITIMLETHKTADMTKLYQFFRNEGYLNIIGENGWQAAFFEVDNHYLLRKK